MQKSNERPVDAALKALLTPTSLPSAFAGTTRPIAVTETQIDSVKRGWHEATMISLVGAIEMTLKRADFAFEPTAPERVILQRMGKYGIEHTGRGRPENKKEAVRVARTLLERYDAATALAVLDTCIEERENEHDLCDALLLALQEGDNILRAAPTLGSVRVLGIDPGTRNLGVCVLEVTGHVSQKTRSDGTPSAPLPLFRIHDWMLIDLLPEMHPSADTPFVVKIALPAATAVLRPSADVGALLSLQYDREQAARKRRNAKAKERRAALKTLETTDVDGTLQEASRKRRNEQAKERRRLKKRKVETEGREDVEPDIDLTGE